MNSALPDYYEMLGLAPSATPEEVKKRYRELARRYHPDVNPSPEASHQIKAVNEAYHTLNDPDRRALYDANRILSQPSASRPSASSRPTPPPRSGPSAASPGSSRTAGNAHTAGTGPARPYTGGRAGFNGFGRTAPDEPASAPPPRSPNRESRANPQSEEKARPGTAVNTLLSEAQLAFINRRYKEAEALCKQALAMDKRNATVYELLGDIYVRKGQTESATTAYSYAIQFNPRNYSIHGKLDRLMGRHEAHEHGPTVTRPVNVPRPAWGSMSDSRRDVSQLAFSGVLALAAIGLLCVLYDNPGEAIVTGFPWLTLLSPNLLIAALLDGLFGGILLSFYGGMRPVSEELVRRNSTQVQRSGPISLVLLLGLFSVVLFYLSVAVFLGVGIIYGKFSRSLLRAYLAAGALVGIFVLVASESGARFGNVATAVFAGNLLFPAVLVGWLLGDRIRLRGRR